MSKIIKIHKVETKDIKNGVVIKHEESIVDGTKGLSFKLFDQKGDKMVKYLGRSNEDGTFNFVVIAEGKKDEMKNLSLDDLKKELKKVKGLKFVVDYLDSLKQKGGKSGICVHGGADHCPYSQNRLVCPFESVHRAISRTRKSSRKGPRKSSKKVSKGRKSRRRSSKRKMSRSKKGSRKGSKKGSKRKASKRKSSKRKSSKGKGSSRKKRGSRRMSRTKRKSSRKGSSKRRKSTKKGASKRRSRKASRSSKKSSKKGASKRRSRRRSRK